MYHHIGLLFFSKSRSFAVSFPPTPISIYQICLLSRYLLLCSVSFQIGHTKMDFFSFFLKFKYGQIVSFKNSESSCEKVVVFVLQQQQVVQVWWSWMLLLCDSLRMLLLRVYWCVCELVMSACLWLSIVSAFRSVQILFSSLF